MTASSRLAGDRFNGQQPVAARHVHFAVEHDAGAVAGRHVARQAGVAQHLGDRGGLPAGQHLDGLADLGNARANPAPEHPAPLRGVGAGREFFNPLHRKSQRQRGIGRGHRQLFQNVEQAQAVVAAPAVVGGLDHVVALERRDRHDGGDFDARLCREFFQRGADVGKCQFGIVAQGVELVDGKDNAGHAQQVAQQ